MKEKINFITIFNECLQLLAEKYIISLLNMTFESELVFLYARFFRKYGWRYIPGFLFLALCSYVQTLPPLVLGEVFDLFDAPSPDRAAIMGRAGYMVMLALLVFALRFIWRYFIMGNSRNLECTLREQLFEHLQQMPPTFYHAKKTGDLMAYAINDIGAIRMTFGPALSLALQGVITGLVSVATMMTQIDMRLSLLALTPVPLIVVLIVYMGILVRRRFTVVQKTFAEVSDRVNENVGGIRVVKAYVQENREIERFEALNERAKQSNMAMVRVSGLLNPLIQFLFGVSFVIGIVYGARLVRSGSITVGDFVAFNSFLTLIMHPIMSIGRIINIVQRGNASGKRLKDILDTPSNVPEGNGTIKKYTGRLEVRDLTFTFPGADKPALKNISFELTPGKTIGIIGHTGSGKTALASALMKFYPVPDGTIFMEGMDVNDLRLDVVRAPYGCVPQDGFLFSDTIGNNIRFFDDLISPGQMDEAAKMADIYDTIQSFPKGYETDLGERGVNLSGGQKQRLAIARALAKNPAIYLFDDALAAVDTRTEERITANLRKAMAGASAILIAHRASVIMHADEILLMEEGQIVERGTHAQLLAMDGKYAQLWRIQSGQDEEVQPA